MLVKPFADPFPSGSYGNLLGMGMLYLNFQRLYCHNGAQLRTLEYRKSTASQTRIVSLKRLIPHLKTKKFSGVRY